MGHVWDPVLIAATGRDDALRRAAAQVALRRRARRRSRPRSVPASPSRGPHTFYLKKRGAVDRWGGALINLLHYQDAAALTLRALTRRAAARGRVLAGCDDGPLTLREIMEETLASPAGYTAADPADPARLEGGPGQGRGKRMTNPGTRAALGGWAPEFPSFRDFMRAGADDWYRGPEAGGAR